MKKRLKKITKGLIILSLLLSASFVYQGSVSAAISKQFWLQNLIVLPSDSYDQEEADLMVDRLLAIPHDVLETLVYYDVKIKLVNGKITDEPEMAHLRGVVPRGWEGYGRTWDDIPGAGGNPTIIRIGYSEMGQGHGAYNLELHETFHSIDTYVFQDVSQSNAFYRIFDKEANNLFAGNGYQEVYPEEYFAEVASMYILGGAYRELLRKEAPETYAFLHKMFTEYKAIPEHIDELYGHWAQKDMERLSSLGVISGFPDGTVRPEADVSREQFIKMLVDSTGAEPVKQASPIFSDVISTSWSAPYIHAAVAAGIVLPEEYAGGSFQPTKILTRAEMAIWVARAMKLAPNEQALTFEDADSIKNHRGLVGATVKSGIMSGMPGNLFQPNDVVTRAQAAAVLNRMLND